MIKFTILIILGQPNSILDVKKGFDKTLKNIPAVSVDLLRIALKCMKIAQTFSNFTAKQAETNQKKFKKQLIAYTHINNLKY